MLCAKRMSEDAPTTKRYSRFNFNTTGSLTDSSLELESRFASDFVSLLCHYISNRSLFFYQESLTNWIDDIDNDEGESDTDEEPVDDETIVISEDSMSESGTDEEDELRPSKPITTSRKYLSTRN